MTIDFACFAKPADEAHLKLYLQVDGMRCAACAWKIESALNAEPGVEARLNYATQRLRVLWEGTEAVAAERANAIAATIEALGFHVAPFDPDLKAEQAREDERFLLRCLAVAGFATGNVMLFSQALWFSPEGSLFGATRDLMHWLMALIALPCVLYSGRPFFRSALSALAHGRTNMDVPISLAVVLASALSLFETVRHGEFVYFDASVMLLFFLLIGRYLDLKARGKARAAAEGLLAMLEGTATRLDEGEPKSVRIADLSPGMVILTRTGEKVAADGVVRKGASEIDTSAITGETLPRAVAVGERIFAGTINVSAPLEIEVSAASDDSLLSQVVALMEKAEQGQAAYVRIADRVASLYAPVVHVLAAGTFAGWWLVGHVAWQDALLRAMAVLIITCPCALGLAVPVVQVLASGQLFKQGILLKSGKGLETLARADTVVFDKTGTLTSGRPQWLNTGALSAQDRQVAVSMARRSAHPLSQALGRAGFSIDCPTALEVFVTETPGQGLSAEIDGETVRLGRAKFVGVSSYDDGRMELWLRRGDTAPQRLVFEDAARPDAAETVAALKAAGLRVILLSGDRVAAAEAVARSLGVPEFHAEVTPVDKVALVERLRAEGRRVLMVGDGLNDAAALSAADVSMSPATAMDITQNAADFVWRGDSLMPVFTARQTAVRAQRLVTENFGLSLIYNLLAVPMAIAGMVTPMIAALAMSGSSLIVIANAFRLRAGRLRAGSGGAGA